MKYLDNLPQCIISKLVRSFHLLRSPTLRTVIWRAGVPQKLSQDKTERVNRVQIDKCTFPVLLLLLGIEREEKVPPNILQEN